MKRLTVLVLVLALAGCGAVRDSKLNPFNWFGRSAPVEKAALPQKPGDPRPLVAEVLTMEVDAVPTGAIVRATGRTPTQGWWNADLVALPMTEEGVLILEFRLFPPVDTADVNTPRSREVTAAISLSNVKLRDVRQIVVQGATNARAAGR
ncbi:hypothetical protein [Xinfangfangia pollutisoli]|uniref:hypothetical protein n=1 Tax=Xinfangfangia pollutisoli TaxID=2865960 RepID=UPI001CD58AC7|nr:hypothetical protein [Xinfangfangia pollutisoli]